MPLQSFGCSICGEQAPIELRQHGKFKERMKWLREHYKKHHPQAFHKSQRKSVKTKHQFPNPNAILDLARRL